MIFSRNGNFFDIHLPRDYMDFFARIYYNYIYFKLICRITEYFDKWTNFNY
jgi:hypothetical protein